LCEVPEPVVYVSEGFLGVDLGIANMAMTSDGDRESGRQINQVRHRNRRLRARLQNDRTEVRDASAAGAVGPSRRAC
jgi:hypothetical protein